MTYEIQTFYLGTWKTVARRDDRAIAEHYARLAARQYNREYRVIAA